MTPAHKTSAILVLAGLVASGVALLQPRQATSPLVPLSSSGSRALDASGMQVDARMQSSHLLRGLRDTHLAVTLEAPMATRASLRPPVNLAIVLDRSGSMSGEKLLHAKQAARQLVHQLQTTDRVAIVTYGSDVTVSFPSARASQLTKSAAYRAIDSIYDDGGTNLSGGLLSGRDEIMRNPETGAVDRIVLISDGLANEGIVNRDELDRLASETAEHGVSITTVGVGLDFDEQTMTRIAVSGRGNYYFAESSAVLSELFTHELEKLGATIATQVELAITQAPGVTLLEAYGYPMESDGQQALIPVADLHAGETRKVVLHVQVDAATLGNMDIASITVSFRPTDSLARRSVRVASHVVVTEDEGAVLAGSDRDAIRHIERARMAEAINEATRYYETGDSAAAAQVIETRRQEIQSIAASVGDEDLDKEMTEAAQKADKSMEAPADSRGGQRARKGNRAAAYDLLR